MERKEIEMDSKERWQIIRALEALFRPADSRMNLTEPQWMVVDSYNKGIADAIDAVNEIFFPKKDKEIVK